MCVRVYPWNQTKLVGASMLILRGHMTYRVQGSYGRRWEGKADHFPVPAFMSVVTTFHS